MFRCAFPIEDRPSGFGKGSTARLTAESLYSLAGFAEFFKVLLLIVLKLPVVRAGFIWTKVSRFGKLLHLSPSDGFASSLHHSTSTLKRETIGNCGRDQLSTLPSSCALSATADGRDPFQSIWNVAQGHCRNHRN